MSVERRKVAYVPDTCYYLDTDCNNNPCFDLVNTRSDKPYRGPSSKEQRMPHAKFLKAGAPKYHWDAYIIVEYPDGTADLEIHHPKGSHILLHPKVYKDETGQKPNTWYPVENRKKEQEPPVLTNKLPVGFNLPPQTEQGFKELPKPSLKKAREEVVK